MKKNGYYKVIKLDIYPFDIMVSIDESDDVLSKRLLKFGNEVNEIESLLNMGSTVSGRALMLRSGQCVIRLRKSRDKCNFIGVITHESFHITTFILERVGVVFDMDTSDEAYAYLLGYITSRVCNIAKV